MFIPFHDDNPTVRLPIVTVSIIVINLAALLYCQSLGPHGDRVFKIKHGFIPARLQQLENNKTLRIPIYGQQELAHGIRPPQGEFNHVDLLPVRNDILQSTVTSIFLHAGWIHLLGNMWFLWIFGNNIEDRLGHLVFFILYMAGGLLASACHVWMIPEGGGGFLPVVGASGAVAVVLGAYAVTYPFARVKTLALLIVIFTVIEVPAILVLGFWFLAQMASAARVINMPIGGGVAWWAHIGGFAVGAILMPLLNAVIPDNNQYAESVAVDGNIDA